MVKTKYNIICIYTIGVKVMTMYSLYLLTLLYFFLILYHTKKDLAVGAYKHLQLSSGSFAHKIKTLIK